MALAWPGRDEHRTLLFQLGRLRKSQRQSNTATSATSAIRSCAWSDDSQGPAWLVPWGSRGDHHCLRPDYAVSCVALWRITEICWLDVTLMQAAASTGISTCWLVASAADECAWLWAPYCCWLCLFMATTVLLCNGCPNQLQKQPTTYGCADLHMRDPHIAASTVQNALLSPVSSRYAGCTSI